MTRFLIIPNEKKDKDLSLTRQVAEILTNEQADVFLEERYLTASNAKVTLFAPGEMPEGIECLITVGGDGTVLEASRLALRLGVPLLGINLGRLGYLAELEPADIDKLRDLVQGRYSVRERMTLKVALLRGDKTWEMPRKPVNDVVFYRSDLKHVVSLSLQQGEGEKLSYLADGLILATPSGSTAYSLSAGGPILSASLNALCVTPICPHSFYNRSLIFDTDQPLYVRNTSDSDSIVVTMDGRENFSLAPGETVAVTRSEKNLQMISFTEPTLLDLLHQKMK
jgi:NAD+ kinase